MDITIKQACDEYITYLRIKTKYNSYRTIKNKIINYILNYFDNDIPIHTISKKDILKWQEYIENKGFSISYKKTLHICFVMLLNYCIRYYDLQENVASIVGNFKNKQVHNKGNIWTIEEFKKFDSVIDNVVYKVLFETLFYTGCRVGELLAIQFKDIESNELMIYKNMTRLTLSNNKRLIESPKTQCSIRNIVLDDITIQNINSLKDYYITKYGYYTSEFYVFGAINPLSNTTIARYKNKYCKLANVKQIKIHEFRHSHACLLYQNNVPIDEISKRLGHSKTSMTIDVYLKYLPRDEKRVLNTLNSLHTN